MIELKLTPVQNNWMEATWTEVTQAPDVVTPEAPAILDEDGNEVTPAVPEKTKPGAVTRTEVKYVCYHPTQLDLLQADAELMGTPLDEYADMLAAWHLDYVPEPDPIQTPEERWAAIKAIRDRKTQSGGYKVGEDWFHSDTFSRTQQMGLVMLGANIPRGMSWKTMDGVFVPMTQTLAQQIFMAAATQDGAMFAHAEALKADPAADINAGWPETFQGA